MDRWISFDCAFCGKGFMFKEGSKPGESNSVYQFEYTADPRYPFNSTTTRYACLKCAKEKGFVEDKNKKEKLPEGEGIAISVEDYKLLKFARKNPICKMLYKVIGNR